LAHFDFFFTELFQISTLKPGIQPF